MKGDPLIQRETQDFIVNLENPRILTPNTSVTVNASANLTMESGKYYSVYLAGEGSSSSEVTTTDDMTPPPSGQARVCFVHLSSAAALGIDLIATNGTKVVAGLAYKTASAYNNVDAKSSFTLYAAGSVNALFTIPTFTQAGKIYTVYMTLQEIQRLVALFAMLKEFKIVTF